MIGHVGVVQQSHAILPVDEGAGSEAVISTTLDTNDTRSLCATACAELPQSPPLKGEIHTAWLIRHMVAWWNRASVAYPTGLEHASSSNLQVPDTCTIVPSCQSMEFATSFEMHG